MHPIIKKHKDDQKKRAVSIKHGKLLRKPALRPKFPEFLEDYRFLHQIQWRFRHYHIALSELRGRTRSEIEVPAEWNEPDEEWIKRIKADIQGVIAKDEIVCVSA